MLGCVTNQCTVAAIIMGHKQSYLKPGEHLYSQERGCAHYAAWQLLMLLYRCVLLNSLLIPLCISLVIVTLGMESSWVPVCH